MEGCNPLWSSQHWTTLSCCCLGYSPDIHLNLFTVIGYLSPPKSGGRVITCNVILYNPSNPLLKCSFLAVLILFMYQLFAASQQLKGHSYYGLNVFLSNFFFPVHCNNLQLFFCMRAPVRVKKVDLFLVKFCDLSLK